MGESVHASDCLYNRSNYFIDLERLVLVEGRRFCFFFPSRQPGVPLATWLQKKCAEDDGHVCMWQWCHPCQQSCVMSFCVITSRMWWEMSLLTFATELTVRKWLQSLPSWVLLKIITSASLSLSWLIWCWEKDGQKKQSHGCLWEYSSRLSIEFTVFNQVKS